MKLSLLVVFLLGVTTTLAYRGMGPGRGPYGNRRRQAIQSRWHRPCRVEALDGSMNHAHRCHGDDTCSEGPFMALNRRGEFVNKYYCTGSLDNAEDLEEHIDEACLIITTDSNDQPFVSKNSTEDCGDARLCRVAHPVEVEGDLQTVYTCLDISHDDEEDEDEDEDSGEEHGMRGRFFRRNSYNANFHTRSRTMRGRKIRTPCMVEDLSGEIIRTTDCPANFTCTKGPWMVLNREQDLVKATFCSKPQCPHLAENTPTMLEEACLSIDANGSIFNDSSECDNGCKLHRPFHLIDADNEDEHVTVYMCDWHEGQGHHHGHHGHHHGHHGHDGHHGSHGGRGRGKKVAKRWWRMRSRNQDTEAAENVGPLRRGRRPQGKAARKAARKTARREARQSARMA